MTWTLVLLCSIISSALTNIIDDDGNRNQDFDEAQDNENEWHAFESLLVEESVLPDFSSESNSSAVVEFRCPTKCLCFESTVRCMMLGWDETNGFELVPSSTAMLWVTQDVFALLSEHWANAGRVLNYPNQTAYPNHRVFLEVACKQNCCEKVYAQLLPPWRGWVTMLWKKFRHKQSLNTFI